jgi:hypothetical protein
MAQHNVSFTLPRRKLGNEDIEFYIKTDGTVFGKLTISNGSIVWFLRGSKNGIKAGWKNFDQIMQADPKRFERRK